MALADTAKLLASLELKDNFTPTVNKALGGVDKLEGRFGKIGGIASKGFKTLGQNIKNIVTGPVGILGLGAGVLGLTRFLQDSVGKAKEFGEAVFKVKAIIGGATSEVSQLVDVLGDYGIETDAIVRLGGMFEKNIGNIAKSTKTAAKFQQDYGVSVFDSTGKVKSFNEFLLESADIFTSKTIPQSQKAAILSKLYGRNWQELVPILAKGRAELEKTLGKGITLTDSQAKAMERARKAGIRWEDAIGDLQTMIGIELLPALTKFVNKATNFVQAHGDEIRSFFRDAAKFAMGMGRAIKTDVLPAIQKIGDIWAAVPDDLKKILIGGFVLNKATGGAITGIVSELGKGLIKGVLGINAGVVNINAATVNGGGAPGGGVGGVGVGAALVGGATIGAVAISAAVTKGFIDAADATARKYPQLSKAELIAIQVQGNGGLENIGLRAKNEVTNQLKALGTDYESALRSATSKINGGQMATRQATTQSGRLLQQALHQDTSSTNRNLDQVQSAVRAGASQTSAAIRNKKLSVNLKLSQRQRQAIAANLGSTAQGKPGFHYTKSQDHSLDIDRVLAAGAVGVATKPTTALFGEAGNEAFAILRNPRTGTLGGAAPIVNVTVNIDPRRVTKKQTSSGIYKTYVAT